MPWGGRYEDYGRDGDNGGYNSGYNSGYYSSATRPTDRNSDTYAQDMRAYIARQEYQDYLTRFAPVEQELINSVMGPEQLEERLSAITVNNQTARNTAEKNMQMVQGRYGVSQSAQQQQQTKMDLDRTQALSQANGMNQTRTHIFDRNMNALAGGSGAIRGTIRQGYGG